MSLRDVEAHTNEVHEPIGILFLSNEINFGKEILVKFRGF